MPAPVLLAPVGVQTILHPDGELATARAAAEVGLPVVASTAAAHSIEEVAQAAGDAPRWYQLYWPKEDEIRTSLVRRAERAGYQALVVTLDSVLLGWRPADLSHGVPALPGGDRHRPVRHRSGLPVRSRTPPEEDLQATVGRWVQVINKVVTWDVWHSCARSRRCRSC